MSQGTCWAEQVIQDKYTCRSSGRLHIRLDPTCLASATYSLTIHAASPPPPPPGPLTRSKLIPAFSAGL